MTSRATLISLLPSADVDLARWMLSHWGLPYDERPHAPIFHILALRFHGARRLDSPLLIHEGVKFAGVERIAAGYDRLAAPDRRLLPDADTDPALHGDVMALQHDLRWTLGMGTVKWAYFHFLQDRALVWPSFTTGVPIWEKAILSCGGFGFVKSRLTDALNLSQSAADDALGTVRAGFDLVETRLADGRPYLCGDRLTLADLAFATSGGPMVLAQGYGGHLPPLERCPSAVQAVVKDLRARPAGQYIQRLYDTYRRM